MRYAVRRPKPSLCEEEFYFEYIPESPALTVFEDQEEYEDTGIVDEHGNEIVRFVGILPIGFLADQSE